LTSSFGGHTSLAIGDNNSIGYIDKYLAFGDQEVIMELRERVQSLLDDPKIQELVSKYNLLKSKLTSDVNILAYDQQRQDIWKNVDIEGQYIKGKCHKCSESYLDSLSYPAVYNTNTVIQDNIIMADVFENIHIQR
jgi:hypothetical protein